MENYKAINTLIHSEGILNDIRNSVDACWSMWDYERMYWIGGKRETYGTAMVFVYEV